jgi:hypothetical protein
MIYQSFIPERGSEMKRDIVSEVLAHHGIKGMHWGVTTGGAPPVGASPAAAKSAVRRAKEAAGDHIAKKINATTANDNAILKARDNHDKHEAKVKQARLDYKVKKAEYKVNVKTQGRAQAKAILNREGKTKLNAAKAKYLENYNKANEETSHEAMARKIDEIFNPNGPPKSVYEQMREARAGGPPLSTSAQLRNRRAGYGH